MKTILTYILVFAIAFLGTTGLVYVLNNKYENIFAFNFIETPAKIDKEKFDFKNASIEEYTKKIVSEIKNELIDSLAGIKGIGGADTVYKEVVKVVPDKKLLDSLKSVSKAKEVVERNMEKTEKELQELKEALGSNNEAKYKEWISATVKLYESMDSKKAAKIITNYSDNVARDIIYAMKKKKAAEILSNLNSEQIVKLTRADDGL